MAPSQNRLLIPIAIILMWLTPTPICAQGNYLVDTFKRAANIHESVRNLDAEKLQSLDLGKFSDALWSTLRHVSLAGEGYTATPGPGWDGSRLTNVSDLCLNHTKLLFDGLLGQQMWAEKVFDALGKLPSGVLDGNFLWLGGFSECRNITAEVYDPIHNTTEYPFRGEYCLVTIADAKTYTPLNPSALKLNMGVCVPDSCDASDTSHLVNTALTLLPADIMAVNVMVAPRSVPLDTAACIVIALFSIIGCLMLISTLYDLLIYRPRLRTQRNELHDVYKPVTDPPQNQPSDPVIDDPAEYTPLLRDGPSESVSIHSNSTKGSTAATNLLLSFSIVANAEKILSTKFEPPLGGVNMRPLHGLRFLSMTWVILGHTLFFQFTTGFARTRLLLSFSIVANAEKILGTQFEAPDGGVTLRPLHGIRFLSMTWVILGHSVMFPLSLTSNPLYLFTAAKRFAFQPIINASVSVDSFFLLSGTLASYLLLQEMRARGGPRHINWALVYFHRFWRLTPPYMLVLAMYTVLLRYLGSGPAYSHVPDPTCTKYWWQNLLYINNLFNQKDGSGACFGWAWYLGNDMQFFLISPALLTVLFKWRKVGLVLISGLIVMNIILTSVVTSINDYPAEFPAIIANISKISAMQDWFPNVYMKPWHRVGPYAVGLLLGYVLYLHKNNRPIRMTTVTLSAGWVLAASCALSLIYGLYGVSNGDPISAGASGLYAGTHRVLWGFCVGWVMYTCATGHGGPLASILSWAPLVVLSRLTYMAYLIHPAVITWVYSLSEKPIFMSDISLVMYFLGFLPLTYGLAFIMSLALEAPMMALDKALFPQRRVA